MAVYNIDFFSGLMFQADENLLKVHYEDLKEKPFYPSLVKYMSSGPLVPMVCR